MGEDASLYWRYLLEKNMSGSPTRWPNGITQDESWQILGQIGIPDPFFYAYYEDDFLPYNSALYTATLDGGSAAQAATTANVNGRVLLTTAAVSTDFVGLQTTSAGFQYVAGNKLFYQARIQIAAHATTSFEAGLIQTTATPATVTDGIYFKYTANGTTIQLIAVTGSTVLGTANLPFAPTNTTDFDLGFYVDRHGNIIGFAGQGLVGNKTIQYAYANLGPIGKLFAAGQSVAVGTPVLSGAITTAMLNPTVAVIAASGAAATLLVDFQAAGNER